MYTWCNSLKKGVPWCIDTIKKVNRGRRFHFPPQCRCTGKTNKQIWGGEHCYLTSNLVSHTCGCLRETTEQVVGLSHCHTHTAASSPFHPFPKHLTHIRHQKPRATKTITVAPNVKQQTKRHLCRYCPTTAIIGVMFNKEKEKPTHPFLIWCRSSKVNYNTNYCRVI